jgi:glycosyltransferase involved in cell wall biosynthesis
VAVTRDAVAGRRGRVLFVHSNNEWYGSDRSFCLLSQELTAQGWEVVPAIPGRGPLHDALTAAGLEPRLLDPGVVRPRASSKVALMRSLVIDVPRAAWRTRRAARAADVVHINTSIIVGALIGGWLARRPVVLHVRESYVGNERAWRWYGRIIRPLVARLIAISADIGAEADAAGWRGRVSVVHNGLVFDPLEPHGDGDRVVIVGRINQWKGHDVLVDALALLRDRGIEVRADVAGDAFPGQEHYVESLQQRIRDRGLDDHIRLLGYVDDVPALLRDAAILVAPSVWPEPFGLALVDAMGRGVACIATNAGGPREIIRNGETGVLIPPGDAAALADAIEELWVSPSRRAELGAAAAADVRSRFSIEATARGVGAVYRQVLPPA